eukprot:tig00021464_g21738.t1
MLLDESWTKVAHIRLGRAFTTQAQMNTPSVRPCDMRAYATVTVRVQRALALGGPPIYPRGAWIGTPGIDQGGIALSRFPRATDGQA